MSVAESFYPPGYEPDDAPRFGASVPKPFTVSAHLREQSASHVSVVNDFHYAMVNDAARNHFFWTALKDAIRPGESIVIEIGTGAGLLAIMAVRLGAKHVYTIEASDDMANVAQTNFLRNGVSDRVTLLRKLSTDVAPAELVHGAPTILVAEILGTLLLSEDALAYMTDVRKRLMSRQAPCIVIPETGVQYCSPIESTGLLTITQTNANAFDVNLSALNESRNEATLVFSKQLGARLADLGYIELASAPLALIRVDFRDGVPASKRPKRTSDALIITRTGRVDALMCHWTVHYKHLALSTHPSERNLANDIGWGQALQLLPSRAVQVGEQLQVRLTRSHEDNQFQLAI